MIKAVITDFSKVLIFSKDETYSGKLNDLHEQLLKNGDYNFWEYFELNSELLEYYKFLSESVDIYIFTNKYIQEYPPIKERLGGIFKRIFIASEMGIKKNQIDTYHKLSETIGMSPDEILFIDDKKEHIEAAVQSGMKAELYINNRQIVDKVKSYLV